MNETLICATGGHTFTRKRTRGRKPRYCPEHQDSAIHIARDPHPAPPALKAKSDQLTKIARQETDAIKAARPVETLQCAAGHSFTRARTRGRKPRWCPEHLETPTPVPEVSEAPTEPPAGVPEIFVAPIQKAQEARAKQVRAGHDSLAQQVTLVLANEFVDPELKRKLKYCQDEIDRGRNDGFITDRRRELLKESKR